MCKCDKLFSSNEEELLYFGCVDIDTEVLSVNGFKQYNQLKQKENIYTWNDGLLELNPIKKIIVKQYAGMLHSYCKGCYNQVITPSHRMIVKKPGTEKYITKYSEDVFKSKYTYEMPVKLTGGLIKDSKISDETIIKNANKEYIPKDYQLFSMRQAKLFLENWLGKLIRKGCELAYICNNIEEMSRIQHIVLIAGYASYIVFGDNRCYILIRNTDSIIPDSKSEIEYSGLVWCLSVKNGTAIFRRHGNIFISGQA